MNAKVVVSDIPQNNGNYFVRRKKNIFYLFYKLSADVDQNQALLMQWNI